MNDDVFLYTIPQWIVFTAVFVSAYGWIENKKAFRLLGIGIFFALGMFAGYVLSGDYFAAREYLTPEEIIREEIDEEIIDEIPFQAKLLPAYIFFLISGIIAILSFFLELKNIKFKKTFLVITGLIALLGFFIIVGALKSY